MPPISTVGQPGGTIGVGGCTAGGGNEQMCGVPTVGGRHPGDQHRWHAGRTDRRPGARSGPRRALLAWASARWTLRQLILTIAAETVHIAPPLTVGLRRPSSVAVVPLSSSWPLPLT